MFSGGFTTGGGATQPAAAPTNTFGFQAPPNASPFTFGTPGSGAAAPLGGTPAAQPTFGAGGSFGGFGATPQQQQHAPVATAAPFSFGTPAAAAPTFGTPAAAAPTFGTVGGSFTGFGTGQQQQQPAAVATAAPFSFGLSTAAPATGNAPSFGTPTLGGTATSSAPATGGFGLGGFGASTTTPASTGLNLNLGATQTQTPAFSFGQTTPAPAGTGTTAPTFGAGGGSSFTGFGATPQQQQQPAPVATAAPFSFGLSTATTAAPASTAPVFGAPTLATATTSAAGTSAFTFGTTTTTPASTGLTLNLGSTQPAFSFGSTAAPTTTTANSFGFNLGGSTVSSTATQPTAATTTTFTGLGGVQPSGPGGVAGSGLTGSAKPEGRAVLDMPIPAELLQIVEDFKNHMKNQKVKMSEICRANDKNIDKVTEEVEETRLAVSNISNQVQRQVLFSNGLMKDIQDEMKNLDMAMVTKDTPFALQHEITAPTSYFYNLVSDYHERMIAYKREIERAEIALTSLSQSSFFSPQDLVLGLKGTKETVIALAARVQDLHEQLVNEVAVNRNLKRFPMEGEGGAAGRRGGGNVHHAEHLVGTAYDQAFNRMNALFNTPQRSSGNESIYRPSSSTPLITGGMTSPQQLFHTASSTILGSPGGALKRTKH